MQIRMKWHLKSLVRLLIICMAVTVLPVASADEALGKIASGDAMAQANDDEMSIDVDNSQGDLEISDHIDLEAEIPIDITLGAQEIPVELEDGSWGFDFQMLEAGVLSDLVEQDDIVLAEDQSGRQVSIGLDQQGMDSDALLQGYLEQVMPGENAYKSNKWAQTGRKSLVDNSLTGTIKMYELLGSKIKAVANGKEEATIFKFTDRQMNLSDSWWTAKDLGISRLDGERVKQALLEKEGIDPESLRMALWMDYPYELYWYDYNEPSVLEYSLKFRETDDKEGQVRLSHVTYSMPVAPDFARDTYRVNKQTKRIKSAVRNIKKLLRKYDKLNNYEKLRAYADEICGLAEYDREAEGNRSKSDNRLDSLIPVFDGDRTTNSDSSGYAKAFKYLCDVSTFKGAVACEMMQGHAMGSEHVWNAVSMSDGRCYLVDLAAGDVGKKCDDRMFMKACVGRPGYPYLCQSRRYTLDEQYKNNVFGAESPWLKLSNGDYGKDYEVIISAENGRLIATPSVADPGKKVTLKAIPAKGCSNAEPIVMRGNKEVSLTQVNATTWTFKMPYGEVSARASFKPKSKAWHAIVGLGEYQGGTVIAKDNDVEVAGSKKGREIILVISPRKGYLVKKPSVLCSGKPISVKKVERNSWKFTMPDGEAVLSDPFRLDGSWQALQEEINSAKNGAVIKLTRNVRAGTGVEGLIIPENKRITLDLAGHTLDRGLDQPSVAGYAISVCGKLTLMDSSGSGGNITGAYNVEPGGAIVVESNARLYLEGGSIRGNKSANDGGGVYVSREGIFRMKGGAIRNNTCEGSGGGICASGGAITIYGGEISDNTSKTNTGGGIYAFESPSFTIKGGVVSGNQAKYGGGICLYRTDIVIKGGIIQGNTGNSDGGGVYASDSAIEMNGATIADNCALSGGGVYLLNSSLAMSKGSIENNIASSRGGGVGFEESSLTISGSPVIAGNLSTLSGSAEPNNVYTGKLDAIAIGGALSQDAHIGVSGESHVFTSGLGRQGNIDAFFSDSGLFVVERSQDATEAQIVSHVDSGAVSRIKPYTEAFNYIAYSNLPIPNGLPPNTAEHFERYSADAFGFTSLKGDLRLTSDNRIVLSHYPGFTLNEAGKIIGFQASNMTKIHDLTYTQCMSLRYEGLYEGKEVGVCDFETYISICSRTHKDAFITIRDEYIPELVKVMMPIIYKYSMQDKCIINSFTLDSLKIVKQYDPSIKLSWVIGKDQLTTEVIDTASELGNCALTLYCFWVENGGINKLASYEYEIIYAQNKGIPLYAAILDVVSIIDQLKQLGICGAQMLYPMNSF